MPLPILIDTDMGVDDAIAITLALLSAKLSVKAIVSVGGNVPLLQGTQNIGRLLGAIPREPWPIVGVGLDQRAPGLADARHVFGRDGMGETAWPVPEGFEPVPYTQAYRQVIERHAGEVVVVAIGPLTNLAAIWRTQPGLLRQVSRIVIMGGAIWCPGNVKAAAEFNFYRDPGAAETILSAGLPVTLVPLDLTQFIQMDESHVARLTGRSHPATEFLSSVLAWPMRHGGGDSPPGRLILHDAAAVGWLVWPELFLGVKLGLKVQVDGPQAGKCQPLPRRDTSREPVSILTSVGAVDFLENVLEVLCSQRFVV